MTTVLNVSPDRFVSTPSVERVTQRASRYLESGYSVHLRGPAGVGKTTLALHLAHLRQQPIFLMIGDDEFKTSDLIGNKSGYTRKKLVDNYIHTVLKVEDELKHNWIDSRLTLACKEGFTLIYDEFNRSRPEVNNVLLSVLEEKMLVLPPSQNQSEYIQVHPQFRVILTSNSEEWTGVHATQDALLDRVVTIGMGQPDISTEQNIIIQKTGINPLKAEVIIKLVRSVRERLETEDLGSLRSALMISKVCHDHDIPLGGKDSNFSDLCADILISRANLPRQEALKQLDEVLEELFPADQLSISDIGLKKEGSL
ncbi:gas vesicle protein GvpN [Trichodesmium erythraeum IMS101]|uniref:Gas vesicle protein GvpN n=1 Tax=Trichodesmium erythraeum (strain IMS101) TaxID=203124 RepID=Q112L9_TRIEI